MCCTIGIQCSAECLTPSRPCGGGVSSPARPPNSQQPGSGRRSGTFPAKLADGHETVCTSSSTSNAPCTSPSRRPQTGRLLEGPARPSSITLLMPESLSMPHRSIHRSRERRLGAGAASAGGCLRVSSQQDCCSQAAARCCSSSKTCGRTVSLGVVRLALSAPERTTFFGGPNTAYTSVSTDGRRLAFLAAPEGVWRVWVRSLHAVESILAAVMVLNVGREHAR